MYPNQIPKLILKEFVEQFQVFKFHFIFLN